MPAATTHLTRAKRAVSPTIDLHYGVTHFARFDQNDALGWLLKNASHITFKTTTSQIAPQSIFIMSGGILATQKKLKTPANRILQSAGDYLPLVHMAIPSQSA